MFCKNCGSQMNDNAAFCVTCGAAAGQGNAYCGNCGNEVAPGAAVCLKCGAMLNMASVPNTALYAGGQVQKSKLCAGLLGIFLGGYGVHNFYLGYTGKAIAQVLMGGLGVLLTILSCGVLSFFLFPAIASGIWGLIEGIMILTGSISVDGKGVPLKE